MDASASAPYVALSKFLVVEDVITRSLTASGHLDGADDASAKPHELEL